VSIDPQALFRERPDLLDLLVMIADGDLRTPVPACGAKLRELIAAGAVARRDVSAFRGTERSAPVYLTGDGVEMLRVARV